MICLSKLKGREFIYTDWFAISILNLETPHRFNS